MTKEEAVKEIEKAFEPAFANYIITALTEGATVSDKEPTTKNDLGVDCNLDDFIKYCKRTFGIELTAKKSDNPDTYVKLFGTTNNDLEVDCINRQAAITFVCKNIKEILKDTTPLEVKLSDDYIYENVAKIMRNPKVLPSVTPQEPKWIPVKTRKLTRAEEQEMLERGNYFFDYAFDCKLPEDGEEVLVTTSTGEVTTTTFFNEGLDGCYFEYYEDDGDVIAWMPKPKSYKTKSEVEDENDD